jgi:hypothetical protein
MLWVLGIVWLASAVIFVVAGTMALADRDPVPTGTLSRRQPVPAAREPAELPSQSKYHPRSGSAPAARRGQSMIYPAGIWNTAANADERLVIRPSSGRAPGLILPFMPIHHYKRDPEVGIEPALFNSSLAALSAVEAAETVRVLVTRDNFTAAGDPNGMSLVLVARGRVPSLKAVFVCSDGTETLAADYGVALNGSADPAAIGKAVQELLG